ncbi:MAG: RusA family crossover junction endodeoxyribonuclease [Gemmatimonadota bacterium]
MTLISLIAPGQPVSAKNHQRVVKYGDRAGIRSGKAIERWYERVVPELARQFARQDMRTIRGHIHLDTHQFLQHDLDSPANPDADGILAGVFDALQKALVVHNDRQIVGGAFTRQRDQARPRVEIEIRVLPEG